MVEFVGGCYETDDPDEIAAIERVKDSNRIVDRDLPPEPEETDLSRFDNMLNRAASEFDTKEPESEETETEEGDVLPPSSNPQEQLDGVEEGMTVTGGVGTEKLKGRQ